MRKLLQRFAFIFLAASALLFAFPALGSAALDCTNPANTADAIKCGSCNSAGVSCSDNATKHLNNSLKSGIDLLSVIVGIAAVVMIVLAGFRYITSGGKQESIASAKNTLVYAIVGLVIVALAQTIARFVLTKAAK